MSASPLDLDAYFARIGYDGPREATLDVLRELHRLHPAAIPFENLTPLMGDPVSLELGDVQAKLVAGGRGGYCYEHNGLFKAVLVALGFQVQGLAARVRWGAPDDAPLRPRSHMLLLVDLPEGRFLADVGFGGLVKTAPLAFEVGPAQMTPHGRFRLVDAPDGLIELQGELSGDWRAIYRFDLSPQLDVDYLPMNLYSAIGPGSPFHSSLMAARAEPHRRLALSDTRYTIRPLDGEAQVRTLESLAELAEVLTRDFGLILPEGFERIGPKLGLS
jgi:N-hydroxyarylamine O-acetyltransferase